MSRMIKAEKLEEGMLIYHEKGAITVKTVLYQSDIVTILGNMQGVRQVGTSQMGFYGFIQKNEYFCEEVMADFPRNEKLEIEDPVYNKTTIREKPPNRTRML